MEELRVCIYWGKFFIGKNLEGIILRNRKTEEASECFLSAFFLKPSLLDALRRFLQISPTLNSVDIQGVLSIMESTRKSPWEGSPASKNSLSEALEKSLLLLKMRYLFGSVNGKDERRQER